MVIPAPEAIKKSIGHEAAEALGRWFQDILETKTVSRDEYRHLLTRLEVLEKDVFEIKQDMKDFRKEVNQRFDLMEQRFDQRFDGLYAQMGSLMKWTVGTLALFGTIISALLAIGQFVK
jgi:hypothetical protein